MRRATIHQAYFIPWLGYFSKLAFSDIFVVLDNVQFRKRHYFDRTRIVNMHGEIRWLSLPVGENFRKKCYEVHVKTPDDTYIDKIIRTIRLSYAKARFYEREWDDLRESLLIPLRMSRNLVKINVGIIRNIINLVGINMPSIYFASEVTKDFYDDPTQRIIEICEKLDINAVIIGSGKSLAVHNWRRVVEHGVSVYQQDYLSRHPIYEQSRRKWAGFQKGLSIIDAILNVGREKTSEFLQHSMYNPVPLDLEQDHINFQRRTSMRVEDLQG